MSDKRPQALYQLLKLRRPDVNLADLARVVCQLNPQQEKHLKMMSDCLGFTSTTTRGSPPSHPYSSSQLAYNRPSMRRKPIAQRLPDIKSLNITMPAIAEEAIFNEGQPECEFSVKTLEDVKHTPGIPDEVSAVPVMHQDDNLKEQAAPRRQALFPHKTSRAIIGAAVAQAVTGPDLDIHKLIQSAAQRQFLTRIPQLPVHTLRDGCQLLLDFSDAMMPWWQDLRDLTKQFHSLLSPMKCPVYEFEEQPLKAERWTEQGQAILKITPSVPLVIVSDLGVNRHSPQLLRPTVQNWVELADICRRNQKPFVALVPVNPEKLPGGLPRNMQIVHWDPVTTAATVNRLFRQLRNTSA